MWLLSCTIVLVLFSACILKWYFREDDREKFIYMLVLGAWSVTIQSIVLLIVFHDSPCLSPSKC